MAKDSSTTRISRSRTDELRREIDESLGSGAWARRLASRTFLLSAMIWSAFVLIVGATVVITRELPKVDKDRVMSSTRVARAEFKIVDEVATEQARNSRRVVAPRVCVQVASVFVELRAALDNLPLVVQGASTPEELDPELRRQFALTPQSLAALQGEVIDGKVSPAWTDRVTRLHEQLLRTPILGEEDYREATGATREIELRVSSPAAHDHSTEPAAASAAAPPAAAASVATNAAAPTEPAMVLRVPATSALTIANPSLDQSLRTLVAAAGFSGPLIDVVTTRLTSPKKATYVLDPAASAAVQAAEAAAVKPIIATFPAGEVVYKRGDILKDLDYTKVVALSRAERQTLKWWQVWGKRLATFGLVAAIAAATAGYAALFVPRIQRNPSRTLGVAGLLALMTIIGCWASISKPALIALTGVAPTVFATVILVIAYNQRVALAFGSLHGILMCVALDQPIGIYAVMVAGIGAAVWKLKEVRDRESLVRMGLFVSIALAVGTVLVNLIELPPTTEALRQAAGDAFFAGVGGFAAAIITLGLLPTLERTFGLVTGLKLIELRDPKQPLLRQLQQRAPGTYNHSLTIASLGEAAAESVGADGLLTYVGALYHDIGKMNKPDYFVENQPPGFNRHDKLSPAMSLLVIVGHVKDGMELAREFNLPRPLHHFIESHHGTTLVEYFYHRARRLAEEAGRGLGNLGEDHEEAELPAEIEYRYPGPRPRTKEAAIIMLCDAVESASRTMADPTPSRIDQLVRGIATKRLMDGQFDECDLTLRELNTIVETVSKTLASIYHGRIVYPASAAAGSGTGPSAPATTIGAAPGPKTTKERAESVTAEH